MEKLQWSALEYEEKERSNDWFWALGVIIVAGSLASLIYNNYFFAVLLVISGVLLAYYAIKEPEMVHYELNEKGLQIRDRLYPYENIKSFCVQIEPKPILFIGSERAFMPVISMPIEGDMAERIHTLMLSKNIPEEEMQEHISEKIMEFLGF